jgi:hypothetical protein
LSLKNRVGNFLLLFGLIALLIFVASALAPPPEFDLWAFLAGAALLGLGLRFRLDKKGRPLAAPPPRPAGPPPGPPRPAAAKKGPPKKGGAPPAGPPPGPPPKKPGPLGGLLKGPKPAAKAGGPPGGTKPRK